MSFPHRFTFIVYFFVINSGFSESVFDWERPLTAMRNFIARENFEEAESTGQMLLKMFHGTKEAPTLTVYELLAELALKQKRPRQAARYYLDASQLTTDRCHYQRLAANAYYQNQDYHLATVIYEVCDRQFPNDEVRFSYACALIHAGNIEQAETIRFDSEPLQQQHDWNLATYWNHQGKFQRACNYLLPWIDRQTTDWAFYDLCAQMKYRLGEFNSALNLIERTEMADKLDAHLSNLQLLKMRISCRCNRPELSVLAEADVVERDRPRYWLWRCLSFLEAQNWEQYESARNALLDTDLQRYLDGGALILQGKFQEAKAQFNTLGQSDSPFASIARLRAQELAYRLGSELLFVATAK